MSRRTAESNKAILAAWNKEQELVQEGKGTRDWTPKQQQDILEKGKAYDDNGVAFQGQHMKSAEMYPEYQGDPGNIQFLTRAEHLEAHNGNWRNPTNWYFNPVTKEKIDFGEGPFTPCEIINLPEPIMKPSVTSGVIEEKMLDSIKEIDTKKKIGIKPKSDTVKDNTTNTVKPDIKPPKGFVKKAFKVVVDFFDCHPLLSEIAKAVSVAGIAVVTDAIINGGRSGSGDSESSDYDYNSSGSRSSTISDSSHEVRVDNSETDLSIERTFPEKHMVKEHGQHYHYKDGSVRWKKKVPYPRGGNKDE